MSPEEKENPKITASCGHKVHSSDELIDVNFPDEEVNRDIGGFSEVTVYAVYCKPCADTLNSEKNQS